MYQSYIFLCVSLSNYNSLVFFPYHCIASIQISIDKKTYSKRGSRYLEPVLPKLSLWLATLKDCAINSVANYVHSNNYFWKNSIVIFVFKNLALRRKPPTVSVRLDFLKCVQIFFSSKTQIWTENVSRFSRQQRKSIQYI